jgi:hypothetical protein
MHDLIAGVTRFVACPSRTTITASRLGLCALEDRTAPAGALDSLFGPAGTGMVPTSFANQDSDGAAVALQADGKIVVIGSTADTAPLLCGGPLQH